MKAVTPHRFRSPFRGYSSWLPLLLHDLRALEAPCFKHRQHQQSPVSHLIAPFYRHSPPASPHQLASSLASHPMTQRPP
jgi:hypothetical protein